MKYSWNFAEKNATTLVKRDIVPFLDTLLKSEHSNLMLKLVHIAAMLSRNGNGWNLDEISLFL